LSYQIFQLYLMNYFLPTVYCHKFHLKQTIFCPHHTYVRSYNYKHHFQNLRHLLDIFAPKNPCVQNPIYLFFSSLNIHYVLYIFNVSFAIFFQLYFAICENPFFVNFCLRFSSEIIFSIALTISSFF